MSETTFEKPTADLTFSVIVPTYRRPERLAACVKAVAELDFPCDQFELIVVDDGSPTNLEPTVRESADTGDGPPLQWRFLRQDNAGPGPARNYGASQARGQFLAFTDDDCRPAPGWLKALQVPLEAEPDALVGGDIVNELTHLPCSEASQQLVGFLYEYFNQSGDDRQRMLCSNNMAMSREKFEAMGGFHFAYGATAEDRELCLRWQSAGLPIRLEPEAVVRHAHAMRLRQFLRQHFNYGLGALHFHRVRQDMGHPPMRPEPMSFYMRMIGYPLRRSRGLRAWRLSALLFLSQAANAMGYFVEQRRADAKASST